jgi:ABC-type transport system involved in multi-copper enzyme maturation permease subunit
MARLGAPAIPDPKLDGQSRISTQIRFGIQVRRLQRRDALARVMSWELRRFGASRILWVQALAFFVFLLLITWAQRAPDHFGMGANGATVVDLAGTSAWGLLVTLPTSMLPLVLLVPFLMTDGVTRDLQRRTYELVMTTVLPAWAYVWGRFLAGLLVCLSLALLLLAAVLSTGAILHWTVPHYPFPAISAALLLWVAMVVPATILAASCGFAFGTLFPSLSTPIKVVILAAWILGGVIVRGWLQNGIPPSWYVNWDPTSTITGLGVAQQYSLNTGAIDYQLFDAIENKLFTIGTWFPAHLVLGGVGLLLVLFVSRAFKRSHDVLA